MSDRYIKNSEVRWRREVDGVVLYIPKTRSMKELNNVAAYIWELLDGSLDVIEIINIISDEFNMDKEVVKSDINNFLKILLKESLIEAY